MTERLYYDDAYLLEFTAVITETKEEDGSFYCRLDRSAFYPTSGGQPFDTGTINGIKVLDVFVDDGGDVWHKIETPLEIGACVSASIDRERRMDHMQQHAADHMIAGTLYELLNATTIGLHIGEEVSSIDVSFENGATHLSAEMICRVEDIVNRRIRENGSIRCWFPTDDELKELPLRKKPTVSSHIRIVAIGDYEMVACGGTHPMRTGEIGLVKIMDVSPARGKARITFKAGKRAFEEFRKCFETVRSLTTAMTTSYDRLEETILSMRSRSKDCEKELRRYRFREQMQKLYAMSEQAPEINGVRIVSCVIDEEREILKDAASELIRKGSIIALLGAKTNGGYAYVFAAGKGVGTNMGTLLKESGAHGGGRPDFAQGSGGEDIIANALKILGK